MPPANRPALGKGPTGKDKPRSLSVHPSGSGQDEFAPEAGPSHPSSPGSVASAPSLSPPPGTHAARLSPSALDWSEAKSDMMQQQHSVTISPSITPGPYSSAYAHQAPPPSSSFAAPSPVSPPFSTTQPSPSNASYSQSGMSYMSAPPPAPTPRPQSPHPYGQGLSAGRPDVSTPMFLAGLQGGSYPSPAERSLSHGFTPSGYIDSSHAYASPISAEAHDSGMPPMLHRASMPGAHARELAPNMSGLYGQRRAVPEPHAFRPGLLGNHHAYMGAHTTMDPHQHSHLSPTHAGDGS
jgi:hypothetical protein